MELEGKVAVVTGAAGVVVCDLDRERTEAVAAEIGDRVSPFAADVADEAQTRALIAHAEETFGPVDLFCANAGVAIGVMLEDDEAVWDAAFGVNVRSHIYAARALVPGWLERGEGYFLTTASAAGLVTQIGSAPYAVTKHAAVAFAEWLSVSYGDQGIG